MRRPVVTRARVLLLVSACGPGCRTSSPGGPAVDPPAPPDISGPSRLDLSNDPTLQAYLDQLPTQPDLTRFEAAEVDEMAKVREGVTVVYENMLRDLGGEKDRDTHRKTHGCVRAEWTVAGELPKDYQRGVLVPGKTYPTWLRFANGKGTVEPDKEDDTRSISIKLMGVDPGPRHAIAHETSTQDFILQNSEVFLVQTMEMYISLLSVARDTPDRAEAKKLGLVGWLAKHPYERKMIQYVTSRTPKSLMTEQYWSGSTYLLGAKDDPQSRPVRYTMKPCEPQQVEQLTDTSVIEGDEHYYRNEMSRHLKAGTVCYRFGIQELPELAKVELREHEHPIAYIPTNGDDNEVKHLVEDVTMNWDRYSPHVEWVATLTIFRQEFDHDEVDEYCHELAYSPYNGLIEHRPLGTLNRLRAYVYPVVRDYRRPTAPKPYPEPTAADVVYTSGRL